MLNVKSILRFFKDANYSQNEYIFDHKTYISNESPRSPLQCSRARFLSFEFIFEKKTIFQERNCRMGILRILESPFINFATPGSPHCRYCEAVSAVEAQSRCAHAHADTLRVVNRECAGDTQGTRAIKQHSHSPLT